MSLTVLDIRNPVPSIYVRPDFVGKGKEALHFALLDKAASGLRIALA